jgi:sugar phosphate permease
MSDRVIAALIVAAGTIVAAIISVVAAIIMRKQANHNPAAQGLARKKAHRGDSAQDQ